MTRVIPSDVQAIRPSTQDPIPFILTASLLVDTHLGSAGLSTALLTEIERWLAAHLMDVASSVGGSVTRRQFSDTSISYSTSKLGDGLAGTRFGQQVLLLYPPFAALTTLKRATFLVD